MSNRATQPDLVPPTNGEISRMRWEQFFARIEAMKTPSRRKGPQT